MTNTKDIRFTTELFKDKESAENKVAVRKRVKGDLGALPVEDFKVQILDEIRNKRQN